MGGAAGRRVSERISCIMASRGAAFPARLAIDCYRQQTYPDRELIVVSAHPAPAVAGLIAQLGDPSIRFVAAPPDTPVGLLRNQGIAAATGALACVWDDDDLSHPQRLQWQYDAIIAQRGSACVIGRVLLWWPKRRRLAFGVRRTWENTLLARRATMPAYSDKRRGSDTAVLDALLAQGAMAVAEQPDAYIYVVHGDNLWGDEHFEMLFGHGHEIAPAAYAATLARLGRAMPIEAYRRDSEAGDPPP